MTEQEITTLLESLRQRQPQPADPRLRHGGGYRRWGHAMRLLRTIAALVALSLITITTTAVAPAQCHTPVAGALSATPDMAYSQIHTILEQS